MARTLSLSYTHSLSCTLSVYLPTQSVTTYISISPFPHSSTVQLLIHTLSVLSLPLPVLESHDISLPSQYLLVAHSLSFFLSFFLCLFFLSLPFLESPISLCPLSSFSRVSYISLSSLHLLYLTVSQQLPVYLFNNVFLHSLPLCIFLTKNFHPLSLSLYFFCSSSHNGFFRVCLSIISW